MENKKKLTIALFSVCAAVIVGLIVAVSVLAAGTQNINSAVNVTFKATSIEGTVTGTYQVGTKAVQNMKLKENGTVADPATNVFSFAAADQNANAEFVIDNIALDETNKYVVFNYTFTAGAGTLAYDAKVVYSDTNSDDKNMTVEYRVGEGEWAALTAEGATANVTNTAAKTISVRATVTDVAKDAIFTGSFAWTLTAAE